MPCLHKFAEYLPCKGLYFDPITLIVGTFNPGWPGENPAEWFYGRTSRNYFWDVLPRLYDPDVNLREANHIQWKKFCFKNRIAITDIIVSIEDAEEDNGAHQALLNNFLDNAIADNFHEFEFTNLVQILEENPSIQNVYLTRQPSIALFDDRWALVEQYALEHPEKNLHIRQLLTPSGNARFQIAPYTLANPHDPTPLRNFIYTSWLQHWHEQNQ